MDFESQRYYLGGAVLPPKPIQKPRPVVYAGQAATGMRFGAPPADFSFQAAPNIEEISDLAQRAKALAGDSGQSG